MDQDVTEDSKRIAVLNAAITEFSSHGYRKSSTEAIVRSAGVSKGLLFHYFGSKKALYLATYDHALKTIVAEFVERIDLSERDLLKRWRQIALLKMALMRKHPAIFDFVTQASFPDDDEVREGIEQAQRRLAAKVYPLVFGDIDRTLFRPEIDVDTAVAVVIHTMESYARAQADPTKSTDEYLGEWQRYLDDLDRYSTLFHTAFYRHEVSRP